MKKLFLLIALLCIIIPKYLIAQNLGQDLQNFSITLQHITTILKQSIKPIEIPTKPTIPPTRPTPPPGKPVQPPPIKPAEPTIPPSNIPTQRPIEPTKPTPPSRPIKPHIEPIHEPTKPIEIPPKKPIEPSKPIQQPTSPIHPQKPIEPGKPAQPSEKPVQPPPQKEIPVVQPTKPVEPTKPLQPPSKPPAEIPLAINVKGPNFTTWKNSCDKLPKYTTAQRNNPPKETALTVELFTQALETYFVLMKAILEHPKNWLEEKMPNIALWNKDAELEEKKVAVPKKDFFGNNIVEEKRIYGEIPFVPFAQKTTFKTTDHLAFHGDFHGDIHACNNFIQTWIEAKYMDNNFKIIDDNFYIIFLGDYTDRGWYGAEVIYTLLRLKIANPTHVFMARGNHEDLDIINDNGFIDELLRKFPSREARMLLSKITRFYNFLPMVFYFSCPRVPGENDTIQCCHGGIEIGYNPQSFLVSEKQFAYIPTFMRANNYSIIQSLAPGFGLVMKNDVPAKTDNGFMWSDFIVEGKKQLENSTRGEGIFEYGQTATKALLLIAWKPIKHSLHEIKHTLRGIFRAHQHTSSNADPMKQIILNFNETNPGIKQTAPWYKAPAQDAGIAFLWSDSQTKKAGSLKNIFVLTFSVSPGTPYDWPYDAFGLLTLAEGYDNWNMHVYRKPDPI